MKNLFMTVFLVSALFAPAAAYSGSIETKNFDIDYSGISDEQAKRFARKAERALRDVTRYFARSYDKRITIEISDRFRIARARRRSSKILIPANQIRGDAGGLPRFRGRRPPIVHEITHLVAASRGKSNRFLDEGLGVYMQEKFGTDRTYPNMGREVHEETARMIKSRGGLIPLLDAEETRTGKRNPRALAYLEEGSFVRYMIENHGLAKFMKMYDGTSFKDAYGREFEDFDAEWTAFIESVMARN